MTVAFLVDTNLLVYVHDPRFPAKQAVARQILRRGITTGDAVLPYQAVIEFMAAVRRPLRQKATSLLSQEEASRVMEEWLSLFPVIYPTENVIRLAVRGTAAYQLSWFDALIWAHAEHYGIPELWSEDFQTDRLYGTVRTVNPFS
ncbi:MAG: PIN domain-containing protein [bacterium]